MLLKAHVMGIGIAHFCAFRGYLHTCLTVHDRRTHSGMGDARVGRLVGLLCANSAPTRAAAAMQLGEIIRTSPAIVQVSRLVHNFDTNMR
jgi:hypothetical protein